MRAISALVAALLSGACTAPTEVALPLPQTAGALVENWNDSSLGLIEVQVQAPVVKSGQSVSVSASNPALVGAAMTFQLGDVIQEVVAGADGVAAWTATAPAAEGDHVITVSASDQTTPFVGYTMFSVLSDTAPCPPDQILEANGCLTPQEGHRLHVDGFYRGWEPGRNMVHAREGWFVGDSIVLCNTDSVAVIPVDQSTCPYQQVVEVIHDVSGLKACEHIEVDESRSLALTTSRGDSGAAGGLVSWHLPSLSGGGDGAITLGQVIHNMSGYEDLVRDGDIVYVVRKEPGGVEVFCLDEVGQLQTCGELVIPDIGAPWGVTVDQDWLYLTDIGSEPHDHPPGLAHLHDEDGHVHIMDVTTPQSPTLVSSYETVGPPRSLVVMDQGVMAVAVGTSGIELVDISVPSQPTQLLHRPSMAAVYSVAYSEGYLMSAEWNAIRLYDSPQRGILRPLDAEDLHPRQGAEGFFPACSSNQWQLRAASFVSIKGNDFIGCELSRIVTGKLRPGHVASRVIRHDYPRIVSEKAFDEPMSIGIRFDNAGRDTVLLVPEESEHVTPVTKALALGPGEKGMVEVMVDGKPDGEQSTRVLITSNEPGSPQHPFDILAVEGQLSVGDPAPDILLPLLECPQGACQVKEACFDSQDSAHYGKPIVLAFFGSW